MKIDDVPAEVALRRAVAHRAVKVAVFGHTKLATTFFRKVAELKDIGTLVTDSAADAKFLGRARRMGIEVLTVQDVTNSTEISPSIS